MQVLLNRTQNTERYKGMEQVKIVERRTEQMEITINPHGTSIVCAEWTHEKNVEQSRINVEQYSSMVITDLSR